MDNSLVGRLVHQMARMAAIAGGAVLAIVVVVVVVSIVGRALIPLGLSAVPGDFEIVQAGMLFAIFVFLPWCHLERGHALVAILTDCFPVRVTALLEFAWDVVMLVVSVFIAWRLWAGLLDKVGNSESTFILRIPLWMIYASGVVGAVLFVVVAAYCAVRSLHNFLSAHPERAISGAAE